MDPDCLSAWDVSLGGRETSGLVDWFGSGRQGPMMLLVDTWALIWVPKLNSPIMLNLQERITGLQMAGPMDLDSEVPL